MRASLALAVAAALAAGAAAQGGGGGSGVDGNICGDTGVGFAGTLLSAASGWGVVRERGIANPFVSRTPGRRMACDGHRRRSPRHERARHELYPFER